MPGAKRNAQGRYEKTPKDDTPPIPNVIPSWVTGRRLTMAIIMIILVSPWMFMMIKNDIYGSMKLKVVDFYENHFSCHCPCNTTKIPTQEPDTKVNGKDGL